MIAVHAIMLSKNSLGVADSVLGQLALIRATICMYHRSLVPWSPISRNRHQGTSIWWVSCWRSGLENAYVICYFNLTIKYNSVLKPFQSNIRSPTSLVIISVVVGYRWNLSEISLCEHPRSCLVQEYRPSLAKTATYRLASDKTWSN